MKRRILNSSYAAEHRRRSTPSFSEIFRHVGLPRARQTPTPAPLGTLWDHTLLDRLQMPLTRYRE
jgi:hypothetical protein